MDTKELIAQAISLPVEERAAVIDSLLQSLVLPEADIDAEWVQVANRRRTELRSGSVEAVAGDAVFERIWKNFER